MFKLLHESLIQCLSSATARITPLFTRKMHDPLRGSIKIRQGQPDSFPGETSAKWLFASIPHSVTHSFEKIRRDRGSLTRLNMP
ncbi:hypothetical protein EA58_06440 [Photobacterium galatheae]|uniref:Uncharacterized protein n=1 Tax=Photobacterium galatheae TaxID=1654360 RepID=A0A066RXD6_9GAMM|nr:hypothetical protein EA58_06440 [Photobacterium galatheae]